MKARPARDHSLTWPLPPTAAMDNGLLLTLTLEGAAEGSAEDQRAADAFLAGLVADLNDIEAVRAHSATGEEAEPGSKALGELLLGVLSAEVNGENAIKVLRYLRMRLLDQPRPVHVKFSRKEGADWNELVVEVEGSAKDQEAIDALLTRLEMCVERLR